MGIPSKQRSLQIRFDPAHALAGMGLRLDTDRPRQRSLFTDLKSNQQDRLFWLLYRRGKRALLPLKKLLVQKRGVSRKDIDPEVAGVLLELPIFNMEDDRVFCTVAGDLLDLGSTFEYLVKCVLEKALNFPAEVNCHLDSPIESIRSLVSGADWDVLATFKLNSVLWIECKYGYKVSKKDIITFLQRSSVLCADLSIYLQNTSKNYDLNVLEALRGCEQPLALSLAPHAKQVVACVHPNRYFLRIAPKKDDWGAAVRTGIEEALYLHHRSTHRKDHRDAVLALRADSTCGRNT